MAIVTVVISLYYYFAVIRAMYWGTPVAVLPPVAVSWPARAALALCAFGLLWLGLFPANVLNLASLAAASAAVAASDATNSPS